MKTLNNYLRDKNFHIISTLCLCFYNYARFPWQCGLGREAKLTDRAKILIVNCSLVRYLLTIIFRWKIKAYKIYCEDRKKENENITFYLLLNKLFPQSQKTKGSEDIIHTECSYYARQNSNVDTHSFCRKSDSVLLCYYYYYYYYHHHYYLLNYLLTYILTYSLSYLLTYILTCL